MTPGEIAASLQVIKEAFQTVNSIIEVSEDKRVRPVATHLRAEALKLQSQLLDIQNTMSNLTKASHGQAGAKAAYEPVTITGSHLEHTKVAEKHISQYEEAMADRV